MQRLNTIVAKALSDREFKAKFLTSQGLELVGTAGGTPEQFAACLRSERATYENVVKLTGIKEDWTFTERCWERRPATIARATPP